jgi:hypothetical protein
LEDGRYRFFKEALDRRLFGRVVLLKPGDEMVLVNKDIVWAAYRAAIRSVFGVGICCAHNGIVIHHSNLRKQKPLFSISKEQCTRKKARLLGANAARLIKGIPFAEI